MIQKTLSSYFSMNRNEEENKQDLWGKYVLPINHKEYNLLHYEKSVHITGGRGIGKTAYLQYHCYPTILSSQKEEITDGELERIGIYWRPDSELLSDMTESVLGDDWSNAFNSYIGLSIFIELSKFLKTFLDSPYKQEIYKEQVQNLMLPSRLLGFLGIENDIPYIEFEDEGHYLRSELNDWLCDSDKPIPFKFKAKDKITLFIKNIQQIKIFSKTKFYIFVDEFENLYPEHQRVINTWIKHVPDNVIFHIAYKKHYEPESYTSGNEQNQVKNDYRVVNIEDDLFGESNFSLLASEIILNKIQKFYNQPFPKLVAYGSNYLSNENFIEVRKTVEYINIIKVLMNNMFPSCTLSEVSTILIEDPLLFKKLNETIAKALKIKSSNLDKTQFIDKNKPEESILNAVLLNRQSINPEVLLEYFINDISKYTSWKNNNLFGAILFIYNKEVHNRKCPYYGGFEHLIQQAALNVRHLLELVHQSFVYIEKQNIQFRGIQDISIPLTLQAEIVKEVSSNEFDRKIAYLGVYGKKLKKITERIGKLFVLAHNNPAQSFAEVNQFAILTSEKDTTLSDREWNAFEKLLSELKIWSVLIENNNTKKWNKSDNNSFKEYRLHPILSSYFGISFRKKRKYDFTVQEIKTIFLGTDDEYAELFKKFAKKNNIDNNKGVYEPTLLDLIK